MCNIQIIRLYRIYFFPIRTEPDFAGFLMTNPAWTETDFQIDCYFTDLMCKITLRTYEWFEFLIIIFLCSSYRYDLFRPTRLSYYSSKLCNVWRKIDFSNLAKNPAPVGFLPEPDFCRIWKKCRIPAGDEIRYSPTNHVIYSCAADYLVISDSC